MTPQQLSNREGIFVFVVSTVEHKRRPHSRGRTRYMLDVSTAVCAAGVGCPAFCERLKKPNSSASARRPQQMLPLPEAGAREPRPVPLHMKEGRRWVGGQTRHRAGSTAGLRRSGGLGHK